MQVQMQYTKEKKKKWGKYICNIDGRNLLKILNIGRTLTNQLKEKYH